MTETPKDIVGFSGIDNTTDPFVLGQKDPTKSSMSLNYRAKNGVRKLRPRYVPIQATGAEGRFYKSGVYFPYNGRAILPHIHDKYDETFYLASTETVSQTTCTIEFWYKADYRNINRDICDIPVYFEPAGGFYSYSHMHVYMRALDSEYPWSSQTGEEYLCFQLLCDGTSTGKPGWATYVSETVTMPTDGDWHHISIVRSSDGSVSWYLDTVNKGAMTWQSAGSLSQSAESDSIATDAQLKTESISPLYYNHLLLGGDELFLADFRMWSTARSAAEVAANYNTELVGTETGLVCYIPLNEGDGKYFTEKVNSARGYFTPQEPWVNDDDELVFTGHKCMAYPSLRSKFILPTDLPGTPAKSTSHIDNCEDGAYDGGILWDDTLLLGSTFDYEDNGVWSGTAQLRIRLRQLKEGVLCGRLGLVFDSDSHRFRLFLVDDSNSTVYTSEPVVDSTWIGVEKTITVKYFGDSDGDDWDIGRFWVDTTEVTDTNPTTTEDNWANGDAIWDTTYPPYTDYDGDGETSGALGGSTVTTEMCIAFDLIFLRQWWDNIPDTDEDAFVADTYNVNILPDEYRIFAKGLAGYIEDDGNELVLDTDTVDLSGGNWESNTAGLAYVRIPLQENIEWDVSDATSHNVGGGSPTDAELVGALSCISLGGTDDIFKQDVLVRRIHDYTTDDTFTILRAAESYVVSVHLNGKIYSNGVLISNLVNCYDQNTFKLNKEERPVFEESTSADTYHDFMYLRVMETIVDGSPVQGIERLGSATYKSRYLALGLEERYKTAYGQKSVRPKWCSGPQLTPIDYPAVRGIGRYKSEDGSIDKLLAVAWNGVHSINESTGAITAEPFGWIDRNSDEAVNLVAMNNRLVIMDTNSAVKINYLGNMTSLGVERPVDLTAEPVQVWGNMYDPFPGTATTHFAYVAQFYDSENNAYSGTIPIISEMLQTVYSDSGVAGGGFSHIDVAFRTCFDKNVDKFRVFRTQDMESGSGTFDALFLVRESDNNYYLNEFNHVADQWLDTALTTQFESNKETLLGGGYHGVDLVPPACSAIAVGYGRMFVFAPSNAGAGLLWSNVDDLGLPIPDEVNPANSIIVEEGNTTEGSALIEYSSTLFAFKDDSIFRIYPFGEDKFGSELIYKGVGCVNQRCVVVAGDAIIFLDRNGVYRYASGEPKLISAEFTDFFRDEVNQDEIGKSFVIHDKDNDSVMVFLPVGEDQEYCNRCLVGDLRNGTWTVDLTPNLTCGYYDDGTLYVGTPHGQIYKMSSTEYKDGAYSTRTGTGTAT